MTYLLGGQFQVPVFQLAVLSFTYRFYGTGVQQFSFWIDVLGGGVKGARGAPFTPSPSTLSGRAFVGEVGKNYLTYKSAAILILKSNPKIARRRRAIFGFQS
ncbi:hypothetical protein [Leptolyngbya sp. FACHB-16]|uniref:hypothetical protein n=1 Tax=unclassified Leptolyngbya TaxID=2650499 RepID=UPI0016875726|nr:hypothetical protein [Leptolyngbya sp. FACHB-16]MBD2154243.1 hypothetical protein [Leptolyngbya sp. FACHB-16]